MLPQPSASNGSGVQATVPVLASLNLAETLQFYTKHLGFAALLEMDNYLILQRDGCELHFWPCDERHIAENTSCYVRANTAVLHADFAARGLQVAPPVIQPWGMKEMHVIDPHGNLLKFGEPA
ncbi:MAG: VOC family protein [Acidovorax sp.]|nr:VOC family protein [Acidovorax sp.]